MSRFVQLQHKTTEHVNVIRCYIGRLFLKLHENIKEINFPFTFNQDIICSTLTLNIKPGNSITSSEGIKKKGKGRKISEVTIISIIRTRIYL